MGIARQGVCGLLVLFFTVHTADASSTSPFPGANGIPNGMTCDTGGCHISSAPDLNRGSVTIEGLPQQWLPNTVYNLVVVVQRPAATRFGFQLSAIFSTGQRQAGALTPGETVVSVVTYIGVQYAQHNDAPFGALQRRFLVTWRSPSTATSGDIDFHVAGNAANGNGERTGDAIYLQSYHVAPFVATLSSRSFSVPAFGSTSLKTAGEPAAPQAGYARITPDTAPGVPSGVAVFGFRSNNVLVSEAGVPASTAMKSGRFYVEVSADGGINTGVAIANPNSQAATILFGSGSLSIPAGGQVAKFLTESPFNVARGFQGSFSFTSDLPVAVIALRGFTNERSDFLMTTLPVADLAAAAPSGTQVLPHYADGGGWTTQIVLINSTDSDIAGVVQFVGTEGLVANSSSYSVSARGAQKMSTSGRPEAVVSGSVRIVPSDGTAAPVTSAIFAYRSVSAAGVAAVRGSSFRMFADSAAGLQTGIAVANAGTSAVTVTMDLYRSDGSASGLTATISLPPLGQTAKFLGEFFPALPATFQGVVRIRASSGEISVVGLRGRTNERSDFLITTTPAAVETGTAGPELFFPHLVDGGGYTTQFILFGSGTGSIRFFRQDGAAFSLTIAP